MKVSMCLCLVGLLLPLISGLPIEDSNLPAPAEEKAVIHEHSVDSNQTDDSVVLTNSTEASTEVTDVTEDDNAHNENIEKDTDAPNANEDSVVSHSNSTVENVDELDDGESVEGRLDETTLDLTTEDAKIEEQSEEYNISSTEASRDTEVEEITEEKSFEEEDDDADKAVEDMDDTDVNTVMEGQGITGDVLVLHSGEVNETTVHTVEDNITSVAEVETTGKPVVNETNVVDYELNAADGSKEDKEDTMVPGESSEANVDEKTETNEIEDQSKVDEEAAQVVKEMSADDAKHAEHEARFTKYEIYFKKAEARFAAIQRELDSVKAQLDSHLSTSAVFSAYVQKDTELRPNATIPYDHIITNIGDHFDADTHSFSAPIDGAYYFSHTTYTSDKSECEDRLHKNGNGLETHGHVEGDTSVVLQLVAGDVITVHPQQNCTVHGGGTVFNGFLIA